MRCLLLAREGEFDDVAQALIFFFDMVLNEMGKTALFASALIGSVKGVEVLLKNKADPEITVRDGATPIFACAGSGHHG